MSLYVSECKSPFHTEDELAMILKDITPKLKIGDIDPLCFLTALTGKESSFGKDDKPRHEPAYAPGGLYFKKSEELRKLHRVWGAPVSCSYSVFQIMYPTAINLGFSAALHPLELMDAAVAGHFVAIYLNTKFKAGANTVEKLAASYNGGSHTVLKSNERVQRYAAEFVAIYSNLLKSKPKEGNPIT